MKEITIKNPNNKEQELNVVYYEDHESHPESMNYANDSINYSKPQLVIIFETINGIDSDCFDSEFLEKVEKIIIDSLKQD